MRLLPHVKSFLVARSTVLALILLLTAALAAAVLVRQTGGIVGDGGAPAPAAAAHPAVTALGLDRVFSTWWFAAVAALFVLSLALSTWDQLGLARARTFHLPPEAGGGVPSAIPGERVAALLAREGYRKVAEGPGRARYVKLWPGYWGQFLLHLGMTVTALFAAVYVLTEHRMLLRLVSGSATPVEDGPGSTRRGLLATPMPLPAAVTLLRVEPAFWPDDHVMDVASALVMRDARGESEDFRVAVNDQQRYRGILVYQRTAFGHAFLLRLADDAGRESDLNLPIAFPARRDQASYANHPLDGGRVLKAKYYATPAAASPAAEGPRLVLRLQEGDRVLGEASLAAGDGARLGPYSVRLASVEWWTEILFEGSRGTAGIFTGFALLLAGAALTFFAVPREVVVRQGGAGTSVSWRTTRFLEFYVEERERILALCRGESAA